MSTKNIGFIGTGNMGGALARAVAKTRCLVTLADADRRKAEALAADIGENATVSDSASVIADCDAVFLGVKPQMLEGLAAELAPAVKARKGHILFITMAAGVSLGAVEKLFSRGEGDTDTAVIRIMPNTPAAVGAGMILYCPGANAGDADKALFLDVMQKAGTLDELPERLIDAASCVSGCGPAFVCLFVEALADGGVRCGLPRDKALLYAMETVKGTAALMEATGQHPGALKDAVCSPGGTTIEGVATLEEHGFRAAAMEAVTAVYKRTLELKK